MAHRRNKTEYQCYVFCLSQSTVHDEPHFGGAETAGTYPGRRREGGGRVQVIIEKEKNNNQETERTHVLGQATTDRVVELELPSWATRSHH